MSQEAPFSFPPQGGCRRVLQKLHSQLLFAALEEGVDQCPPRRVSGPSLGRWEKVHNVLLEDQTWTWSLSPEIAPYSRDPWNSAGSSRGLERLRRPLPEASSLALKWTMGNNTGSSEHTLWNWGRDNMGPRQGVLQTQPSLKSLWFQANWRFPN